MSFLSRIFLHRKKAFYTAKGEEGKEAVLDALFGKEASERRQAPKCAEHNIVL